MRENMVIVAAAIVLCGCGASTGLPASAGPQTTTIGSAVDASLGGGPVKLLTTHRDERGSVSVLAAPVEEVWRVIPGALQDAGVAIGTIDSRTHTIGNTNLVATRTLGGERISRFLSCGQGHSGQPVADEARVTSSLLAALHPEPSGNTRVEIRLTGSARGHGGNATPVTCTTTGRLEQRIARLVAERLSP